MAARYAIVPFILGIRKISRYAADAAPFWTAVIGNKCANRLTEILLIMFKYKLISIDLRSR